MSFSVDLWDGFDSIKEAFSSNCKVLKNLLNILTSYSNVIKDYCSGLDNLSKEFSELKEPPKVNSILEESIELLLSSFQKEKDIIKTHYEGLINKINEIQDEMNTLIQQTPAYFEQNIKNREIFSQTLNNLVSKQETYNKQCNDFSIFLAELEALRIAENTKMKNLIEKDEEEKQILKKTLDIKNDYINCIDETDKERIRFNQKTEEILYNLQKNYKTSIFLFHVSLKNFIKDKIKVTAEISEMNKENENNKYSKIVYEEITNDFILKNATKIFPMNHLEFIPYKPNKTIINPKLSKFNSLLAADKNNIFIQIKNYFNDNKINIYESEINSLIFNIKGTNTNTNLKNMKSKDPSSAKKDYKLKSNFIFINDFVFKLCNSSEITIHNNKKDKKVEINSDEKTMYNTLLSRFIDLISFNNKEHDNNLQCFMKLVAYYRSKGFFLLNEASYTIFVNIFNYILANYKSINILIKNTILFSQTLYKIENDDKIYVLNSLKDHSTFNDIETWHRVINYNLSLSLKINNYSLNISNKEEYINNLNKVALNIIISYLYDLKLSTTDENIYKEVKNYYVTLYGLDEKSIEIEVKKLIDANKNAQNKKEKK